MFCLPLAGSSWLKEQGISREFSAEPAADGVPGNADFGVEGMEIVAGDSPPQLSLRASAVIARFRCLPFLRTDEPSYRKFGKTCATRYRRPFCYRRNFTSCSSPQWHGNPVRCSLAPLVTWAEMNSNSPQLNIQFLLCNL